MGLALVGKVNELKRKSAIGQIIVVVLAVQLLFFGSFIALPLPTATQRNLTAFAHNEAIAFVSMLPSKWQAKAIEKVPDLSLPAREVRFSLYVPLLPLSVFVGYVLGAVLGLVSLTLYFLIGVIGPLFGVYPFAAGGGLDYYTHPGFGYLLGAIAASWCAGCATARRRTSFRQSLAIAGGLLAAHLIGLGYLFGSCLVSLFVEGTPRFPQWRPWVFEQARNMSWYPLPYDLLFSITLVGLGFPFRWLVQTLTAPDIGLRPKAQQRIEDLV